MMVYPDPTALTQVKQLHALLRLGKVPSAVAVMVQDAGFVEFFKASPEYVKQITTLQQCWSVAKHYLLYLLYNDRFPEGAVLCWGTDTFSPEPRSTRFIWKTVSENVLTNVMGAAAQGKSFSVAAYLILEYVLDPEWTRIDLAAPSYEHLKKNIWGSVNTLFAASVIPFPGEIDAESITVNKKTGRGIRTLVLPRGKVPGGKIKGAHPVDRGYVHKKFGRISRIFFAFDEAQQVPAICFDEIPNLLASNPPGSVHHIKVICMANPSEEESVYGQNCLPVGGWLAITAEQPTWRSATGWACVRLNAMLSENVLQGKVVYPSMATKESCEAIIRSYGGDIMHPEVWSQVYGMFPPQGSFSSVVKRAHITHGEWLFDGYTISFMGHDAAFTGDLPTIAVIRTGRASAWKDPAGNIKVLKEPKNVVQVDVVAPILRGDTTDLVNQVKTKAQHMRVLPEHLCLDRTGNATGVHDLLARSFGKVIGVHYAEAPTETKILAEDTMTCDRLYFDISTELYACVARWCEVDVVRFGTLVDPRTIDELCSRQLQSSKSKKMRIEAKDEFKARGRKSPDHADALTLAFHAVRQSSDWLPGIVEEQVAPSSNTFGNTQKIFGMKPDSVINLGKPPARAVAPMFQEIAVSKPCISWSNIEKELGGGDSSTSKDGIW